MLQVLCATLPAFHPSLMILSDLDIRKAIESGRVKIDTPQKEMFMHINASSMDLRLGNVFKLYEHSKFAILDPKLPESFVGVTRETLTVPDDLVVRVEGRSSLGRLGIIVHSTAGFVDPGFSGTITLEISNLNRMPVALYPGMRICQLAFE